VAGHVRTGADLPAPVKTNSRSNGACSGKSTVLVRNGTDVAPALLSGVSLLANQSEKNEEILWISLRMFEERNLPRTMNMHSETAALVRIRTASRTSPPAATMRHVLSECAGVPRRGCG
jgi:hypothetical protein